MSNVSKLLKIMRANPCGTYLMNAVTLKRLLKLSKLLSASEKKEVKDTIERNNWDCWKPKHWMKRIEK